MGNEIINPLDFGAFGDGQTDDTKAFEEIENKVQSTIVNLLGKEFVVTKEFSRNLYFNGIFKINGKVKDATHALILSGNTNVFGGKEAGLANEFYPDDGARSGGYRNVGIGESALEKNTRGWRNVATGHAALKNNEEGYNNVALGDAALEFNVGEVEANPTASDAGSRNTAVGAYSLRYNKKGTGNTAVGRNSAHANESGNYNTAVGTNAYSGSVQQGGQQDRKQASHNTAIGYNAAFNTNADSNTAMGSAALYNNVDGVFNVALGPNASYTSKVNNRIVSVGSSTLRALTGEGNHDNVAVGTEALCFLENGHSNTALGDKALAFNVSGNELMSVSHSIGIGKQSRASGNNQLQLGTSGITTYAYGSVQNRSDERDKDEIRDTQLGLEFINQLRPRDFKWNYRENYTGESEDKVELGAKKGKRFHHGLIAQEVKEVMENIGVDFGGYQDHKINGGDDVLSLGYTELIAPLIKAVQELSEEVESLKKDKKALEKGMN
ncbi:tail fiber domain-containing protein [Jeotgalibacillus marinus]|uniref:Tail fiber domain-containing protein n=1 Tax=Jeotgalibacillus marinus TaxID=86667 RepID=A0ABV3Q2A6_9BACL